MDFQNEGYSKFCAFCSTPWNVPDKRGKKAKRWTRGKTELLLRSFNSGVIGTNSKTNSVEEEDDSDSEGGSKPRGGRAKFKLPANWTICSNCEPHVRKVLNSKAQIRRVEDHVVDLQQQVLRQLNILMQKVNNICVDLLVIDGIMEEGENSRNQRASVTVSSVGDDGRRGRSQRCQRREETENYRKFRAHLGNVLQDLQEFMVKSCNKMLKEDFTELGDLGLEPDKEIKEEPLESSDDNSHCDADGDNEPPPPEDTNNEADDHLSEDGMANEINTDIVKQEPEDPMPDAITTITGEPVSSPVEVPPEPAHDIYTMEKRRPLKRKWGKGRKCYGRQEPAKGKKEKENPSDSETHDDDSSDDDFNPHSVFKRLTNTAFKRLPKNMSPFRKSFLADVLTASRVSTCRNKGGTEDDPRKKYCIRYDYNAGEAAFLVENIEIICLDEEESFKCSKCDYVVRSQPIRTIFQAEDCIFDHILGKHLKAYKCSLCDSYSADYTTYKRHHLDKHVESDFTCDICGKPMSRRKYRRHKWHHLGPEEKADPANRHMMPPHLRTPRQRGVPGVYQCSICGKQFGTDILLKRHESRHVAVPVSCPDCWVRVLKCSLPYHRRVTCQKVKGILCLVCDVRVQNHRLLHKHMTAVHPEDTPYHCDLCDKQCNTHTALVNHRKSHLNKKQEDRLICPFCGTSVSNKRNMQRHETTCKHNPTPPGQSRAGESGPPATQEPNAGNATTDPV